MADNDQSRQLAETVEQAYQQATPLQIVGGNSKAFYGRQTSGTSLSTSNHQGIVSYEPSELVITARSGTPLQEIESALAEHHQMLAFEPPHFGPHATLGGSIASGLSGPIRPYRGSARDFVLGTKILNGKGEQLAFGGEVIKNVAGYDVSRLMTGALGTLGVLLEVSIKVSPKPDTELTLIQECTAREAIERMGQLSGKPLPVTGAAWNGHHLLIRLSGNQHSVAAAQKILGGEVMDENGEFWNALKEQQLAFFETSLPVWRLSLSPTAPLLDLPGDWLLDWGGAQRWLISDASESEIRNATEQYGGHALCFRNTESVQNVFHPLPAAVMTIQTRLKQAFDPAGILNPNRMYPDW